MGKSSSNARDTSSTGVANSSQQPPPTCSDDLSVIAGQPNARDTPSTGMAHSSQQPPPTRSDDLSVVAGQSQNTSDVPESRVTAQTTDAPQIRPADVLASEIHQPNRILTANPASGESATEGESTSAASSVIGTTRLGAVANVSESESSSEGESEEDERGDHSASTEMANSGSLQFTPSSQGSAGDTSQIILEPEDL